MIFKNNEEAIEFINKNRDKPLKPEKEMHKEFVRNFNIEAKKQNSKWFAEIQGLPEYSLLLISKYYPLPKYFSWLFIKQKISYHISCYKSHHFHFVDNDYVFSDYERELNNNFFKLLPEFKRILGKIPQKINILLKGKEENFELRFKEISDDIKMKVKC